MIGGILANNSSGMCCGVAQNSYHTLDSADGRARRRHPRRHRPARRRRRSSAARRPDLHAELTALRDAIRGDAALAARIRKKFATKNTSGYSLNAFLDRDRPADILARLMVGSEGTLGFVAEATLRTVPEPPCRATALVFFAAARGGGGGGRPARRGRRRRARDPRLGVAALDLAPTTRCRSRSSRATRRSSSSCAGWTRRRSQQSVAEAIGDPRALPPRSSRPASRPARPSGRRCGTCARASPRAPGRMRPTGHRVPDRGRGGAGRAPRRGDHRLPGALRAPRRARHRRLRPRQGRQPALRARRGRAQPGGGRALRRASSRGSSDLVVDKYDGAIKAEHGSGRNMAPFVRKRVGRAAYEVDASA